MTQFTLKVHRVGDPPLAVVPPSGHLIHVQDNLMAVVIEHGMQSGEPSIAILGVGPHGIGAMLETSLDKFIMAATGCQALAQGQLGWTQPAGAATIMPNQAGVHEANFHVNRERPDILGRQCDDRNCDREHTTAIWKIEP